MGRKQLITPVKAYTNLGKATLFVNGKSMGAQEADDLKRVIRKDVRLQKGMNKIEVKAASGNKQHKDGCEWVQE
ncbi:MAG: DUF4982 domain-containing protein [Chitinophagaceae bacterium]|nr:MAG: DUF4982 domain-containing protein [Chitinophagaceae bacterium]